MLLTWRPNWKLLIYDYPQFLPLRLREIDSTSLHSNKFYFVLSSIFMPILRLFLLFPASPMSFYMYWLLTFFMYSLPFFQKQALHPTTICVLIIYPFTVKFLDKKSLNQNLCILIFFSITYIISESKSQQKTALSTWVNY